MHSFFGRYARKSLSALICAAAFVAAGCHNNLTSGFGLAWTTVTAEPSDFTTYIVTIDSITLTGVHVGEITALATPEVVDFTQLNNVAELYGSASIPNDTFTSAIITLDYTPVASGGSSAIGVMVNGKPQLAKVVDTTGAPVTTMSVYVNFDPANPLVITPTYASTSAVRMSLNFNLAASNYVDTSTSPATVVVRPFLTIGVQPSDNKLIRVRGPLINTSVGASATGSTGAGNVGTYSVYVRPFYDEVDSLGSLSLFNSAKTLYTIDGVSYTGLAGITQMQQLSAGTTQTISYTTFTQTVNNLPSPPAVAGIFYPVYVLVGSTVEDIYTEGLSGYVIARNGNTLTLRNWISFLNDDEIYSNQVAPLAPATTADAQLLVGPNTTVTVDGSATTGLNSNAISVGQYVSARGLFSANGLYEVPASGILTLDATGYASTNTGSVRIMPTQLWGTLVSSAVGSLVMDVQNINGWPASVYDFTGNGAQTPSAAAFSINTGSVALPTGAAAGDPLWINGIMTPFGSAPPDFTATAVNSETTVQVAGGAGTTPAPGNSAAPGTLSCGVGSQTCVPASLRVLWTTSPGTTTPFVGLSDNGFSIDLADAQLQTAVIRIGPQSIDLKSLPVNPQIAPTTLAVSTTFAPQYSVGNPVTSTITPTVTTQTTALNSYSSFSSFVSEVNSTMTSASPARQFEARGIYNPSANTFTATTVNLVL